MSQILTNKTQISELKKEISLLRSFIIGIAGKDKEGGYNSEFVKKIFQSIREKPKYTFKNKNSFLSQIHKNL
ncbi:MAG: hypothetical protein U9Q27_00540 [Patescibacteria group bacterium]|nr:hypothetical protein [Patescibacteria group bacterium]